MINLQKCAEPGCTALINLRGKFCKPCQDLVRERAARERYYRVKTQQIQEAKYHDKTI